MTSNKRFKRRVRDRAEKTGEPYTTARDRVQRQEELEAERRQALQDYLADVRDFPSITAEEEQALLTASRSGDKDATKAVLKALLRPTADLALELAPEAGLDELDALGEANLVLMQLVAQGDPPMVSDRLEEAVRAKLSTP